ncbi:hypothetical protein CEXT_261581 [Caerostris extrusa]|uniref:Uncharacterized protein n=1 Tax=Caerostris extrusa TaxID=172846 RepID=A0AAV4SRV4_CAEEX|nr:hypothetical protein CEXT_261581 [Caerostris extrusa]
MSSTLKRTHNSYRLRIRLQIILNRITPPRKIFASLFHGTLAFYVVDSNKFSNTFLSPHNQSLLVRPSVGETVKKECQDIFRIKKVLEEEDEP